MRERLILQSIGGGDDWYIPWLALSRPVHERYATACDADYELFIGSKDPSVHPAWNRVPMFLDAFARGYKKVLWLDADTLVVNETVDIFAATDDTTPLHMLRAKDTHVEMPWGEDGWDVYNDGVLVANNCAQSIDVFEYMWSQRHAPLKAHHHASLWEMNSLIDYVFAHRDVVANLEFRFNWMPFDYATPEADAVICAWHGIQHEERMAMFLAKYAETYGVAA